MGRSRYEQQDSDGLNERQRRFVECYLVHGVGVHAYYEAGYKAATRKTATEGASEILAHPKVAAALARARAERAERLGISADRVLEEYAAIAFARMSKFARWGGGEGMVLTPSADLEDADAAAVVQVTETERIVKTVGGGETLVSRERNIKLHDSIKALDRLAAYVGMSPVRKGDEDSHSGGSKDGLMPVKVYSKEDWDSQ